MSVIMRNDIEVGGTDDGIIAKVGTDTLDTTAQDLSNAVNELKAIVDELNSSLTNIRVFGKGTYNFSGLYCFGFVTSSSKNLRLVIQLNTTKDVTAVSNFSITDWGLRIPTGGYITYATPTSIRAELRHNGQIVFISENTAGWGVTNNIPITGTIDVSFQLD